MGPRAGVNRYGEGTNLLPPPWFESQVVQPIASHYTNWAILTLCNKKDEEQKTISLIEVLATYWLNGACYSLALSTSA
jgi:hypothetical protein